MKLETETFAASLTVFSAAAFAVANPQNRTASFSPGPVVMSPADSAAHVQFSGASNASPA